jgi:hypothetical protein
MFLYVALYCGSPGKPMCTLARSQSPRYKFFCRIAMQEVLGSLFQLAGLP